MKITLTWEDHGYIYFYTHVYVYMYIVILHHCGVMEETTHKGCLPKTRGLHSTCFQSTRGSGGPRVEGGWEIIRAEP